MQLQKGKIYTIQMAKGYTNRGVYMGRWKYDIYNEGEKGRTGSHIFCLINSIGGSLIAISKKDIENGDIKEDK
jgi:hypothetical protein